MNQSNPKSNQALLKEIQELRKRVSELEQVEVERLSAEQAGKQAEEALQDSEEKYRLIVENAHDGIEITQNDRIIFTNSRFTEMLGYTADELKNEPFSQIFTEQAIQDLHERHKRRETGMPVHNHYETTFRKKDGTIIDVDVKYEIIDYKGKPATFAIIRDITERKRAEERIQQQNIFLENIIEALTYPFYVVNAEDYTIELANSAARKLQDTELTTCYAFTHKREKPCDGADHPCPLEETKRTGKPAVVEHTHYDRNGNPYFAEVHTCPIFDKDGHIIKVIEYSFDITEQIQTQNLQTILYQIAKASSGAKDLDSLFHSIHKYLGQLIDTKNFYIAFFDPANDLLSFPYYIDEKDEPPKPQKLSRGLTSLVIQSRKPMFFTKKDILEMAEQGKIELIGTPSEQWLGVPLTVAGQALGIVAVQSYRDPDLYSEKDLELLEFISKQITDCIVQKRSDDTIKESEKKHRTLSKQLGESNILKELLLDVITHDLRNPAGVISGLTDLLIQDNPDDEIVTTIKGSSESLLGVIENATTLSRIAVGEELQKESLELAKLIKNIANEFASPLENTGMKIENLLTEPITVRANPIIAEVFRNYISNAIKYASQGKKITIESIKENGFVTIQVKDFGESIPEEEYEAIFQRGKQLEKGVKRGRGLGLAIVERIAQAHDAEVGIKPNKPKGNIFYLRILAQTP